MQAAHALYNCNNIHSRVDFASSGWRKREYKEVKGEMQIITAFQVLTLHDFKYSLSHRHFMFPTSSLSLQTVQCHTMSPAQVLYNLLHAGRRG